MPLIVYMYRSAESSGNLDHVAIKMAEHYEKGHRLNTKISTSMMYPKILAVMIVAVVLILTKFVMPQLQELFDQMPSLPLPTQILNVISNFLQEYWVLAIILILGAWVGARGLMRIRKVRIWWHKCKRICHWSESSGRRFIPRGLRDTQLSLFCRRADCLGVTDRPEDHRE